MIQTFIKLNDIDGKSFKLLTIEGGFCMELIHVPYPVLMIDEDEYPVTGSVEVISQQGNSVLYWENTEEEQLPVASDPTYGPDTKIMELDDGRWIVANGLRGTFIVDELIVNNRPIIGQGETKLNGLTPVADVKLDEYHTIGEWVKVVEKIDMTNAVDLYVADFALLKESEIGFVLSPENGYVLQGQWQHGVADDLKATIASQLDNALPLYLPNLYGYSYVDMASGKDVLAVMDFNRSPYERMFAVVPVKDVVEEA